MGERDMGERDMGERNVGERDEGPTPDAVAGALVGSTLGGIELTSLLGAGGMAEVYRGFDPRLKRYVAVKVLAGRTARDPQFVARFRSEAQRVAALSHPNVVPVFQFGEERGRLYLVMPVLKESLRDRMNREGALDPIEAIALALDVAAALDVAHRQRLVHRDVKPENILLNEDGRPLLSDFGIAREVEALRDVTTARTLVGTPEYMAPEQIRRAVADQRVDVYGLGTVLYEMLTGRVPHGGGTTHEVVARVLTEAAPPPTDYNPAVWPELAEVVLGAVAPDPDLRYPDMSSLAEALRGAVLARGTRATAGPMAALPAGAAAPADMPWQADWSPAGGPTDGAGWDPWGPTGFGDTPSWGMATPPRERRRARLLAAVAVVLVLALGAGGAGGLLLAHHGGVPATTGTASAPGLATSTATAGRDASPGATAGALPTATRAGGGNPTSVAAPTATPAGAPTATASPTAVPTATPLQTPTMVVRWNPLNATPQQNPNNCVATQTLTNISAVAATWSWSNPPPTGGGWQYSTVSPTTGMSGSPPTMVATPPNSSIYVYIKAPLTDPSCSKYNNIVATITVTNGNGTTFNIVY